MSLIAGRQISGSVASASYATTASFALNGGGGSSIDTGSFAITGSNTFIGNQTITGSLNISGSTIQQGSLTATSFTGSLQGTASYATTSSYVLNAVSSSFATTASYILQAVSSSYSINSTSASYAGTASYVISALTASYIQNAQTASYVLNAISSSFSATSSYVLQAVSASYVQNAQSASYVLNAVSSSFAITASYALNGGVTQLLAGPNVLLSPTNGLGQVTISSTSGGGGFNTATGSYGSFYSTQTQTNVAGTARSMSLNTTDITNGVSISGSTNPYNTYIKVENAGVYDIQFSAQVDKSDAGADEIWIWLRKNGTNLTDTATSIKLTGNADHQVAAWNFFANAAANDYFQLMWYSPDANVRLHAEPAFGVVPGIPSLIVTANRVDQFLSNTGSFSGSFVGIATTASFAQTASYVQNAQSASYVLNAVSASYVLSSSFATTASYALTAQTLLGSVVSASYATTASYALNVLQQKAILNTMPGAVIASGSTLYWLPTSTVSAAANENARTYYLNNACTLGRLIVATSSTQNSGGSAIVTIRHSGSSTNIKVTIAAGSVAGRFTDYVNTEVCSANDGISIQVVNNAASNSTSFQQISFNIF